MYVKSLHRHGNDVSAIRKRCVYIQARSTGPGIAVQLMQSSSRRLVEEREEERVASRSLFRADLFRAHRLERIRRVSFSLSLSLSRLTLVPQLLPARGEKGSGPLRHG